MDKFAKGLCEHCHKRKATWTAYREVGFGVEVKLMGLCGLCKRKMEGAN